MSIKILLFDDIDANLEQVRNALTAALGARGSVKVFVPAVGGMVDGTYEDRLRKDLETPPNASIDLIVADRDLSGYQPHFRGLSEATVRRAADAIGVPECGYARGERPDDPSYIERGEQREACIRLSFLQPSVEEFAQRTIAIADGFITITDSLKTLMESGEKLPPEKLLARILGKPEYADKISLYASGDQNRLASVLRVRGTLEERTRRLACLLGYWLWDSVLRFPGVTVGIIPASSYLNIGQQTFETESDVQALFSTALYQGPFAAAKVRMWWRGMLDDIVAASGCKDGREFASKQLGRPIPSSQCCEESTAPAGFYCMLKKQPVSLKNSKGRLPWFPRGADLARVSTSALEELGPWL
jgi:hypothetical protein